MGKNQNNWQRRNTTLTRELPVHWIQCEEKTRELQEKLTRFAPDILPTIPGHQISLGAGSNKLRISKDPENIRTKIWGFPSSHPHCDQWCKSAHGSCSTALTGQCCNTNSRSPDNSHCCKTTHPAEDSPNLGGQRDHEPSATDSDTSQQTDAAAENCSSVADNINSWAYF